MDPLIGEFGLRVAGELDAAVSEDLDRALSALVAGGHDVVLDLREVSFIDSEGLRVLMRAAMALGGSGTLVLAEPSRSVIRLLALTGVEGILPNLRVRGGTPHPVVTRG